MATLKRVLDGFPISMGAFFSLERRCGRQVFFRAGELVEFGSNGVTMWLVGPLTGERKLALLRECYPPGADTGPEMLSNEAEEAGLVLRGEIEITVGEECRVLKAGDGYYFDTHQPHRFRNLGSEVCELVSAATPPTF
ncbi:cupin domain-containing protein [Oceanimonas sp. NS1]|nr:cupin domain-containing protein [Oceanimonas sp. NS1]